MTERYQVKAKNTATQSENKIHDDAVASKLGFSGGLVPGVDVYAYLCHIPAERWGAAWLERGTMSARFASPVYDGDQVTVDATDVPDGLELALTDSKGHVCAVATAALPAASDEKAALEVLPLGVLPDERRPASEARFREIDALGSLDLGFHADRMAEYLDDVREPLALFRAEGNAHPAWLLRQANYILARNVRLGPWIHAASDVQHIGLVRDGDRISVRGRVADVYERKGHRFVELDVQWLAGSERPVMRAAHTAIYEPRGVSEGRT